MHQCAKWLSWWSKCLNFFHSAVTISDITSAPVAVLSPLKLGIVLSCKNKLWPFLIYTVMGPKTLSQMVNGAYDKLQKPRQIVLPRTIQFVINYAYIMYSCPLRWDSKKGQVILDTSFHRKVIHLISVIVTAGATLAQIVSIAIEIHNGTFVMGKFSSTYRIIGTTMFTWKVTFLVSTARDPCKVQDYFNLFLRYASALESNRLLRSTRKLYLICEAQMTLLSCNVMGLQFMALGFYLFNCEFHILSHVLPTCESGGGHPSLEWVALFTVVQMFVYVHYVCSCMYCVCISVTLVLCLRNVLVSMGKPAEELLIEDSSLSDPRSWAMNYRCLQILTTRAAIVMSKILLPVVLLCCTCALVVLNYTLLKVDLGLLQIYTCVGLELTMVVFFGLICQKGAFIPILSEEALLSRRGISDNNTRFMKRFLRSCTFLRINIGNFSTVSQMMLVTMAEVVVDYTIALIIDY